MAKECSNCAHGFVMQMPNQTQGFTVCRRYPPTTVLVTMQNRAVATPENPHGSMQAPNGVPCPVAPNWLCGEWAEKTSIVGAH